MVGLPSRGVKGYMNFVFVFNLRRDRFRLMGSKQKRNLQFLSAFCFVCFLLGGCKQSVDPQKQIIGKWKHTSTEGTFNIVLEFSADGTVSQTLNSQSTKATENGTYKLIENRLEMSSATGVGSIRQMSSAEIEFQGDTLIFKDSFSGKPKATYERIE